MSVERALDDRVALVTGGTGSLGRAVAKSLVHAGARVHVTWRTERERADFAGFMEKDMGRVHLHEVDLTSPASVTRVVEAAQRATGRLDILACIAGGFESASVEATSPEAWDRMMALNATTAFLCCRAAVPLLRASGRGRIIAVGARPALEHGGSNMSAYAASKSAVLGLTYSLAKELGPEGITVNAVVPTIIDTAANRAAMPKANTANWLKPEDIAKVVTFLAGDDARIITGTAVSLSLG